VEHISSLLKSKLFAFEFRLGPPPFSSTRERQAQLETFSPSDHWITHNTELQFLQHILDPNLTAHDLHYVIGRRVQHLLHQDDAGRLNKLAPMTLALRRLPAIGMTLILEMGVSGVVTSFHDVLTRWVILVSFMPLISSICGTLSMLYSSGINLIHFPC
jgi:hypothetical protein